ncbi:hypothetical protein PWY87_18770 [Kribbella solani]|uniref:hypothetical protein n=1 Tax=Kribbella solani TaxID=236067 RepID=UPI0029BE7C98|nr:hypothetical protein [Kribbella solani]MDX3003739.1 hypothetical protein [Kribbella solani]
MPYRGTARREIEAHDAQLTGGIVKNPVKYSHEIAGLYLQAAGDLINGAVMCSDPSQHLAFSPATLIRSSIEYSAWSSWIQSPDLSGKQRVARAVAALRGDLGHPGNKKWYGESGARFLEEVEEWVGDQDFVVKNGLPKIQTVIAEIEPIMLDHYKYLSGLAHGRLLPMLLNHPGMRDIWQRLQFQHGAELLMGVQTLLYAIDSTFNLRGDRIREVDILGDLVTEFCGELDEALDGDWTGENP